MRTIKTLIIGLLILLISSTSVIAGEVKTSSNFCREEKNNSKFNIIISLDKRYYKYNVKYIFTNNINHKKVYKETFYYNNKSYHIKTFFYNKVGYNTNIKVKIKKYKTIIKENKYTFKNSLQNLSTNELNYNNIFNKITNNITNNKQNNSFIKTNPISIPECKIIKENKKITKKTLSRQDALLNFVKNENDSIYSQPLRTTKGYYDCSSFVCAAYNSINHPLGCAEGNTETILNYCENNGAIKDFNSLRPGDIILYFDKGTDTYKSHYKHVTHVSLYIGSGKIFEYSGVGVNGRYRNIGAYEYSSKARAFRVLNVSQSEINQSRAIIKKEEKKESKKHKKHKKHKNKEK